jgi:hypothetical protein
MNNQGTVTSGFLLAGTGVFALVIGCGYWASQKGTTQATAEREALLEDQRTAELAPIEGEDLDAEVPEQPELPKNVPGITGVVDGKPTAGEARYDEDGNLLPPEKLELITSLTPEDLAARVQNGEHLGIQGQDLSQFPLIDGARLVTYEDVALPDYDSTPTFDDEARQSSEEIFPDEILALDGVKVAMDGFMLPLDFENKAITSFVLNPYPPGCCYGGAMPRMDEWVEVDILDPGGCPYYAYRVVRVTGTLQVGEVIDAYGYVTSVYRIKADDVTCLW